MTKTSTETRNVIPTRGTSVVLYAVCLLLLCAGCHSDHQGHDQEARQLCASVIAMEVPDEHGQPERPVVEFPHDAHIRAIGADECTRCHAKNEDGHVLPAINGVDGTTTLAARRDGYHALCLDCHQSQTKAGQETGPVTCGECHVAHPGGRAVSKRQPLRFDRSLHGRHVLAEGEDECGRCHHKVLTEQGKRIDHRSGLENACSDCHLARGEGERPSLGDASHVQCINCHRERRTQKQATGPEQCCDCHASIRQAAFERLKSPPRLKRGQPDTTWIVAPGATANLVPFNHELHESSTDSCSSCHHKTLNQCSDCHTLEGGDDGGGVTLEQAFHRVGSSRSCVGCHQKNTMENPLCASCHHMLEEPPAREACERCHSGPAPALAETTSPESVLTRSEQPPLPAPSEAFPIELQIDGIAEDYGPAHLPHLAVAASYDLVLRQDRLASRFHGEASVPCAACHHRSPPGDRPPPCRSCHTDAAHPTADRPGLSAAYHRQCIGCHQQIGVAAGCTDCHPRAEQRGQR